MVPSLRGSAPFQIAFVVRDLERARAKQLLPLSRSPEA